MWLSLWSLVFACSSGTPSVCASADDTVETAAGPLACDRAKVPTRYVRVLAGRPLPKGSTATGIATVSRLYGADPTGTDAWLDALSERARAIESAPGLKGAELRSAEVYSFAREQSPITPVHDALYTLGQGAIAVRALDDEQKLGLTEGDIEAWLLYSSLAHEARGGGALNFSIAQRVDVYLTAEAAFQQGERAEMIALASFGPVWDQVVPRWKAAPASQQQAWIADAPLPPVQPATSLAWFEAVLNEDPARAAATLHRHFGPMYPRDGDGYFTPARKSGGVSSQ